MSGVEQGSDIHEHGDGLPVDLAVAGKFHHTIDVIVVIAMEMMGHSASLARTTNLKDLPLV